MDADERLSFSLTVQEIHYLAEAVKNDAEVDGLQPYDTIAGVVISAIVSDYPELQSIELFRQFIA